jgi:hypothetical protein
MFQTTRKGWLRDVPDPNLQRETNLIWGWALASLARTFGAGVSSCRLSNVKSATKAVLSRHTGSIMRACTLTAAFARYSRAGYQNNVLAALPQDAPAEGWLFDLIKLGPAYE